MKKRVLISGGSGLVGGRLSRLLMDLNYEVGHLSRSNSSSIAGVKTHLWNVNKMKLAPSVIEGYDYIIHLAGAGIVDKKWSEERKKTIQDSRVKSTQLLKQAIEANSKKPLAFVSASAIGYYGINTSEKIYREEDAPGNDFLAETCINWENSIHEIEQTGVPVSIVRIGLVLSEKGGALKEIAQPVKLGLGAALGSGKQYMPWIHIDDLCRLFIYCMENQKRETYNGVAPNPVNNKEFTRILARVLKKPFFLPNVPAFILKLILGSRAQLVLEGSRVSAEKLKNSGFKFQFDSLEAALENIYAD